MLDKVLENLREIAMECVSERRYQEAQAYYAAIDFLKRLYKWNGYAYIPDIEYSHKCLGGNDDD